MEKMLPKRLPVPGKIVALLVITLALFPNLIHCLHLKGQWETDTFFLFVAKFGFQKTQPNNKNDTQGYIFGNITSPNPLGQLSTRIRRNAEKQSDSNLSIGSQELYNTSHQLQLKKTTVKDVPNHVDTKSIENTKQSLSSTSQGSNRISSSTPASTATKLPMKVPTSTKPIKTGIQSTTTSTTKAPKISSQQTSAGEYPATLAVLDRGYFVEFYRNRNIKDKDEACRKMFEQVSHVVYDQQCYKEGTEHYLKRIPCPLGQICPDDKSNSSFVVKDHQFTYAISDPNQPKFWYVSFVACYRDPETCEWKHTNKNLSINYDLWLVNGNPFTKNQNPLEYQFSFDRQDTVEVYIVFFMCYLVLFPLQVHAVLRQRHIVPRLFTGSVALELTAVLCNVVDALRFSMNGVGHPSLAVFGDIMDIMARAIFMLILLVLAKGWAVTRTELTGKPFIFTIWIVYGVVHVLLYVWKETEVDVIEDIDEYQTWPGWLILVLRNIIMIWFLYELKDTMDHEHQPHKLNFFLHFGAASLVWFIYLPIVALIALQISPLWRSKLLLEITYSADCLAFAVMTHLLWPTRSQQYFLLAPKLDNSLNDELEEFNEAPHVVNHYIRRPNSRNLGYALRNDYSSSNGTFSRGVENSSINRGSFTDEYKDNAPLIVT